MGSSIGADKDPCGAISKSVVADASCTEVPHIGWSSALRVGDCQGVVFGQDKALGLCQAQGWVADELVHLHANTDGFLLSPVARKKRKEKFTLFSDGNGSLLSCSPEP